MEPLARTLGARIHTARRQQGITSNRLAELCGVGAVHIRKIESGVKLPSIQTFTMICNALHTSPHDAEAAGMKKRRKPLAILASGIFDLLKKALHKWPIL